MELGSVKNGLKSMQIKKYVYMYFEIVYFTKIWGALGLNSVLAIYSSG